MADIDHDVLVLFELYEEPEWWPSGKFATAAR
jgi:hypothetical protein